jgi:hypothetical protein
VNFIEQWFGVSPDGGDGSLEVLYLIASVIVAGGFLIRKRVRQFMDGGFHKL